MKSDIPTNFGYKKKSLVFVLKATSLTSHNLYGSYARRILEIQTDIIAYFDMNTAREQQ